MMSPGLGGGTQGWHPSRPVALLGRATLSPPTLTSRIASPRTIEAMSTHIVMKLKKSPHRTDPVLARMLTLHTTRLIRRIDDAAPMKGDTLPFSVAPDIDRGAPIAYDCFLASIGNAGRVYCRQ